MSPKNNPRPRTWRKPDGSFHMLNDALPLFGSLALDVPTSDRYVAIRVSHPLGTFVTGLQLDELSAEDRRHVDKERAEKDARDARRSPNADAASRDVVKSSFYREIFGAETSASPNAETSRRVPTVSTAAELVAAVENAEDGAEIVLAPGLYLLDAPLKIQRVKLTLVGATENRADVRLLGPDDDSALEAGDYLDFDPDASDDEEDANPYEDQEEKKRRQAERRATPPATELRLENLTLESPELHALSLDRAVVSATNCVFRGAFSLGSVQATEGALALKNCRVVSDDAKARTAIDVWANASLQAENCEILGSVQIGADAFDSSLKNCAICGGGIGPGVSVTGPVFNKTDDADANADDATKKRPRCEIVGCQIGDCRSGIVLFGRAETLVRDATLTGGQVFDGPVSEFEEPSLVDRLSRLKIGINVALGARATLENVRFNDVACGAAIDWSSQCVSQNSTFDNVERRWEIDFGVAGRLEIARDDRFCVRAPDEATNAALNEFILKIR